MKRFLTLPVDMENMKIFEVVSNALKKGGKHFMDIMNGSYAEKHFPCKLWDEGEKCLTLSTFEWDKKSKILLYGQVDYPYREPLGKECIGNIEDDVWRILSYEPAGTYAEFL